MEVDGCVVRRRFRDVGDAVGEAPVVVGDVEVAALAPGGSPAVLHDPRAVRCRGGFEVRPRVGVVPSDDRHRVVGVGGPAVAVGRRRGVVVRRVVVEGDRHRPVLRDHRLDEVRVEAVGSRDVGHEDRVLQVLRVRERSGGIPGYIRARGFRDDSRPAGQDRHRHPVVSALVVDARSGRVDRESAVRVLVRLIGEVEFAEVVRLARPQDGFGRSHRREGPAGSVRTLVLDRSDAVQRPKIVESRECCGGSDGAFPVRVFAERRKDHRGRHVPVPGCVASLPAVDRTAPSRCLFEIRRQRRILLRDDECFLRPGRTDEKREKEETCDTQPFHGVSPPWKDHSGFSLSFQSFTHIMGERDRSVTAAGWGSPGG